MERKSWKRSQRWQRIVKPARCRRKSSSNELQVHKLLGQSLLQRMWLTNRVLKEEAGRSTDVEKTNRSFVHNWSPTDEEEVVATIFGADKGVTATKGPTGASTVGVEVGIDGAPEESQSMSLRDVESTVNMFPAPALVHPVGGRLRFFWEHWATVGVDPMVVRLLKDGYQFKSHL